MEHNRLKLAAVESASRDGSEHGDGSARQNPYETQQKVIASNPRIIEILDRVFAIARAKSSTHEAAEELRIALLKTPVREVREALMEAVHAMDEIR